MCAPAALAQCAPRITLYRLRAAGCMAAAQPRASGAAPTVVSADRVRTFRRCPPYRVRAWVCGVASFRSEACDGTAGQAGQSWALIELFGARGRRRPPAPRVPPTRLLRAAVACSPDGSITLAIISGLEQSGVLRFISAAIASATLAGAAIGASTCVSATSASSAQSSACSATVRSVSARSPPPSRGWLGHLDS